MKFFIFDVEATSLHGEGFAVGVAYGTVENGTVTITETWGGIVPSVMDKIQNQWVLENVVPALRGYNDLEVFASTRDLREAFWSRLQKAKSDGAVIFADVAWPVETGFLSACIADAPGRDFDGPYPLYDVGNFVHVNKSRIELARQYLGEDVVMRQHHPIDDCIASVYAMHNVGGFDKLPTE